MRQQREHLTPLVFTDDDGTSYLCYGNGVLESNGKNGARIRKLADDMVSFAGPEITIDAPYFFEGSGINKIGDTYIFHTVLTGIQEVRSTVT